MLLFEMSTIKTLYIYIYIYIVMFSKLLLRYSCLSLHAFVLMILYDQKITFLTSIFSAKVI